MPRPTSWKHLVLGVTVLLVITGAALSILTFARIGGLHGSAFRLNLVTGEARGIIRNSEVWLAGQRVGIVKSVDFLPPSSDPRRKLLIAMDVLESARPSIRRDSHVQIRAGGSLIGSPVVYLSIGTSAAPELHDGDTLHALPQNDTETMASQFAIASREFPDIISNIRLLDAQLHGAQGTLGALGIEHGGPEMDRATARLDLLNRELSTPRGTIGRALDARQGISARAQRVMARVDSVRALVNSDRTSYGRFKKDSTLLIEVAALQNDLDSIRAKAGSPEGTIGRLATDSTIFAEVDAARREMSLLFADLRRHPFRYVRF